MQLSRGAHRYITCISLNLLVTSIKYVAPGQGPFLMLSPLKSKTCHFKSIYYLWVGDLVFTKLTQALCPSLG